VFHAGVHLAGSASDRATFEAAAPALMERVQGFLLAEKHRLRAKREVAGGAQQQKGQPQQLQQQPEELGEGGLGAACSVEAGGPGAAARAAAGDFQRKFRPEAAEEEEGGEGWALAALGLEGPLAELEDGAGARAAAAPALHRASVCARAQAPAGGWRPAGRTTGPRHACPAAWLKH
jgi:hypothetical protein